MSRKVLLRDLVVSRTIEADHMATMEGVKEVVWFNDLMIDVCDHCVI